MNGSSRSFLTDNGEWMLNAVKRNPEGLLLLAAGAVLMLRSGARASGPVQSMAAAYDRGSGDIRQTFDAASDVARQTVDKAGAYASAASEYADKARRVVGEQSERVSKQARSTANSILQNQPLAVVAAGLAAGAVVAATFPPTSLERETLGPIGDQVSKAAERFGDQVKEATSKASERLKTAADQRGVNAEGLKQVADEVVDTFKSSLKGQLGEADAPSRRTEPGTR
jgi:ElaB/YqjD/DUF883 family membrane-anchored ribosome-binding protein